MTWSVVSVSNNYVTLVWHSFFTRNISKLHKRRAYCEAQGKGRAMGGPRKVTQRSFIDGGWWMVDIFSLMLYIKVGFANFDRLTHHVLRLLVVDEELELGLDVHPGEVALHLEPLAAGQLERNARDLRRHRGRL